MLNLRSGYHLSLLVQESQLSFQLADPAVFVELIVVIPFAEFLDFLLQGNNLIHIFGYIIAQLLIMTLQSCNFFLINFSVILLTVLQTLEFFEMLLLLVL